MEREFGGTAFGTYRVERPLGSATTKRAQVRAILEQLIDAELSPGDAIPSERVLVVRLGVSRVTIRQAIADLVDAGVLADEAEAQLRKRFAEDVFGIALIGGGVRLLPDNTVLLERIVNVLIEVQPEIRLSFNTSPQNALDAIRRWTHR